MDRRTRLALRDSVRNYERVTRLTDDESPPRFGARDCPLCHLYNAQVNSEVKEEDTCVGCPVMQKTGLIHCRETPYRRYSNAVMGEFEMSREIREAARAEAEFLASLAPPADITLEGSQWCLTVGVATRVCRSRAEAVLYAEEEGFSAVHRWTEKEYHFTVESSDGKVLLGPRLARLTGRRVDLCEPIEVHGPASDVEIVIRKPGGEVVYRQTLRHAGQVEEVRRDV